RCTQSAFTLALPFAVIEDESSEEFAATPQPFNVSFGVPESLMPTLPGFSDRMQAEPGADDCRATARTWMFCDFFQRRSSSTFCGCVRITSSARLLALYAPCDGG